MLPPVPCSTMTAGDLPEAPARFTIRVGTRPSASAAKVTCCAESPGSGSGSARVCGASGTRGRSMILRNAARVSDCACGTGPPSTQSARTTVAVVRMAKVVDPESPGRPRVKVCACRAGGRRSAVYDSGHSVESFFNVGGRGRDADLAGRRVRRRDPRGVDSALRLARSSAPAPSPRPARRSSASASPAQIATFVVVHDGVARRAAIAGWSGTSADRGVPSRTEPLVGRHGQSSRTTSTRRSAPGRVNVGGEDWAARSAEPIAAGTKIRVVGADGIVLEVTRA